MWQKKQNKNMTGAGPDELERTWSVEESMNPIVTVQGFYIYSVVTIYGTKIVS